MVFHLSAVRVGARQKPEILDAFQKGGELPTPPKKNQLHHHHTFRKYYFCL
jgi:hypothetical protein